MASSENTMARWLVEYREAMLRVAEPFADAAHGPEDIVSIAVVVALDRREAAFGAASVRGWLLAITRSVACQVARKRSRRRELLAEDRETDQSRDPGMFRSSDEEIHREWRLAELTDEQRERVLEVAPHLSCALRQLVCHVLLDGWGTDEIADHYGIKRSAVRQRRKRAVEAIRGRLAMSGYGRRGGRRNHFVGRSVTG